MLELTAEQWQAVRVQGGQPVPMMDPTTQQTFVLIRRELFDSLSDYEDGPWTDEERELLAAEVDAMLDDDMAIEASCGRPA